MSDTLSHWNLWYPLEFMLNPFVSSIQTGLCVAGASDWLDGYIARNYGKASQVYFLPFRVRAAGHLMHLSLTFLLNFDFLRRRIRPAICTGEHLRSISR